MTKIRRWSRGARKLREYLGANGLSIHKFCIEHNLDRVYIQRVLNGEQGQRVTVDFALSIKRATGGVVPMNSWRSSTLKPVESRASG